MFNKDFYPTPAPLAYRMLHKVNFTNVQSILEPSAGKGDLIKVFKNLGRYVIRGIEVSAIEIEPELQAILTDQGVNVIDSDFLTHESTMYYDVIMANFPFSNAEKHLNKALDMIYSGQIVCLVNAQTIKNPYTNERKALVHRLNTLNADIEYIKGAFVDAQRPTGVEVALIYVSIKRDIEMDLCAGMQDEQIIETPEIEEQHELTTSERYADLVADYNRTFKLVNEQMISFYRGYKSVSKYLDLEVDGKSYDSESNLTQKLKHQHNRFAKKIKRDYWYKVTDLPEVRKYLPTHQRKLMQSNCNAFHVKEFTKANIHQFVINLIDAFPKHIHGAIDDVFNELTRYALRDSRWSQAEYGASIHYFNAWKTNNGYKVNKKVIFPSMRESWEADKKLGMRTAEFFDDIELVMSYLKPRQDNWSLMADICMHIPFYSPGHSGVIRQVIPFLFARPFHSYSPMTIA